MPRTGTNYLKLLVDKNFDVHWFPERSGSKHLPPSEALKRAVAAQEARCLVISKHPYSWIVSRMNFASKAIVKRNSDFIALLFDQWAKRQTAWLNLPHLLVRYEDLIVDLEKELARIEVWGLERRGALENVAGVVDRLGREQIDGFVTSRYLEKKYLSEIKFNIDSFIDWSVVKKLGYPSEQD